ncbi:PsiF family protein [Pseudomonas chlororaphis]|uniref:PsiF family protein n=1 Tax=Pseudomonas chlororaphis TaxID=587753 RepID=UPI000F6B8706|nr:PsiF family protein [Pseudomonas chlororaphis]AZD58639.1 Phosphate starvation-inducible protein psiF precursor [Pseudomonas chlororaphis subsp. aurantiaca]AZE15094.1 Phosphate starvation-inducible protein psiF precursor [Pseudomonas chlororaphis subsp. aureofaciens]QQX59547.1 phosphate starvation-inducible protein PsiF [Pseudomonas chlororaphis subsp. aurantiaca]UVE46289.1 phosphate starvation-inducible protein PsiF [Pseudomonas chlororaphis]
MKMLRIPLLMVGLLLCSQGFAATAAQQAQQEKMKSCNAEATTKALKGDERKAFMSTCLKATPAAAATPSTPQERMKTCNADATAKALKGDERKTFMSTCLKKQ